MGTWKFSGSFFIFCHIKILAKFNPKKIAKVVEFTLEKKINSQFIYQKLAKFRQKKNTDSKLPLGGGRGGRGGGE